MIVIERISPDGSAQKVSIGVHDLIADIAPPDGGDEGPNPHDLYDAALGTCKALTMIWYANRNGIPLEDVHVGIERDASEERKGTYRLTARVAVGGPMTDEQRETILAIAAKCPVQKLMTDVTTEIETIFVDLPDGC